VGQLTRLLMGVFCDERGSEITEQVFWIGLVILAVLLLLPQLRGVLQSNMRDLIDSLGA
jgi:hypothetical protein